MNYADFPQHAASNLRMASDAFLYPSHFPFEDSIHEEIRLLKEGFEYIQIDQERIAQLRQESGNSKNYADAVEEILYKELAGYSGMLDAHKLTEDKIFEMIHGEDEEDVSKVKRKKIFTSLFDSNTKSTYYFLKN